MTHLYKLGGPDGHDPIPVDNVLEWATWYETADTIVDQTHIGIMYEVSTIFMGCDFNYRRWENPDLKPILFETMIFSGWRRRGGVITHFRCSTWAEAVEQHKTAVKKFSEVAAG